MKFNWKTFKVLFALVLIIGIVSWVGNLIRPRSYEATDINISIGAGTVVVTNTSEQAALAQLSDSGSRSFRVASTIEGVSGLPVREGRGSNSTYLFEFELPSGTSEFTVSRGMDVKFVANSSSQLEVLVNPVTRSTVNTLLGVTLVAVLGLLGYISSLTEHAWIAWIRNQFIPITDISNEDTAQAPVVADAGQGQNIRSFGDNRSK